MLIDDRIWREIVPQNSFSGELNFKELMKYHTYLKIGGTADILVAPHDTVSLSNLIIVLNENNISFMVIGGGTNMLIMDNGIEGVVISLKNFRRLDLVRGGPDLVSMFVEAGVPLQRLVNFTKDNGYTGIEGLAGIPGFVGGAVVGNAGSFEYEMKDVVVSARIMYLNGKVGDMNAGELGLEYRQSNIPAGSIMLGADIRFRKDSKEDVAARIEDFLNEKKSRQPIAEPSAGCVFKNPNGISAGRLIDESGCKGMKVGDIEVSPMHANFFINTGNGTAADFLRLMYEVKSKVLAVHGINLEPEIKILGRE
ncbi:MAG: UDP-N-acetylmuramate dehydrogenase [Nitrospiraceae bacterium]|nr:UDP-N-acetylmuramate dehydrogenase [Nitrospiraceae bacterium]